MSDMFALILIVICRQKSHFTTRNLYLKMSERLQKLRLKCFTFSICIYKVNHLQNIKRSLSTKISQQLTLLLIALFPHTLSCNRFFQPNTWYVIEWHRMIIDFNWPLSDYAHFKEKGLLKNARMHNLCKGMGEPYRKKLKFLLLLIAV